MTTEVRVTQAGVYVEYQVTEIRITEAGVYVQYEMPYPVTIYPQDCVEGPTIQVM